MHVQDACVNGACVSGEPVSCDDNDTCTLETCDGGDCVPHGQSSMMTATPAQFRMSAMAVIAGEQKCWRVTTVILAPLIPVISKQDVSRHRLMVLATMRMSVRAMTIVWTEDVRRDYRSTVQDNPCTDDSCDSEIGCVSVNNQALCGDGNTYTEEMFAWMVHVRREMLWSAPTVTLQRRRNMRPHDGEQSRGSSVHGRWNRLHCGLL